MKNRSSESSSSRDVILAFVVVVIIIFATLACVGIFTEPDSKRPSGTVSSATSSLGSVPDGSKVKTPSPKKSTAKPKVTKTSTPKPTSTTTKPSVRFYKNCTELRRDYPSGVSAAHPAYQKKMDKDGDGFACEVN